MIASCSYYGPTRKAFNWFTEIKNNENFGFGLITVVLSDPITPMKFNDAWNHKNQEQRKLWREVIWRELKSMNDVGLWYLKEVFFEAAINSPEMFRGYTHFSKNTGFVELSKNEEFDLFIEYVTLIQRTMYQTELASWWKPHPKWVVFRKRVDAVSLNKKNQWQLRDVFTEAMSQNQLRDGFEGIHYKDGLGIVSTIEISNSDN